MLETEIKCNFCDRDMIILPAAEDAKTDYPSKREELTLNKNSFIFIQTI